ncbi:MAG: transposase [Chitinophagaceae bacterium]|nr:transposase [Chitinophagaceae bacterium]
MISLKINELHCKLDQAVNYYNVERPHLSCSMKTPGTCT